MAGQNEVSIILSADATNLKSQLAGARQDIEASVGRGSALGASLQQTGLIFDQFGRQASGAVQQVKVSLTDAGAGGEAFRSSLIETTRLSRTLTDTLVGEVAPGLAGMASLAVSAARETRNLGASAATLAVGGIAVAAVLGQWIARARELVDTQNAAAAAIRDTDFSAATAGLKKSEDDLENYNRAWERMTTDVLGRTSSFTERMAARFSALKIGFFELIGAGFEQLTTSNKIAADSVEKTWAVSERGKTITQSLTATLQAESAALEALKPAAGTVDQLTAAFTRQAEIVKKVADAEANQLIVDALVLDRRLRSAGLIEAADERMGLIAEQANAKRAQADARATQLILQGRQQAAAAIAAQYEHEARLEEIKGAAVQKAIAAAGEELTIAQQRVTREAAFNAEALSNIDGYYARRRALVLKAAAEEIASDERVYQQKRRSLLAQAEALPTGSLPQQRIYEQITILDTQFENGRVDRARQAMTEIRTLEEARVAATQQNNARRFQLEQTYYTQRIALGRASAQEEIEFLRQSAQNAALPLETRRAAEVAFYQKSRELAAQDLAYKKGIGQATVQEEIAHYAQLATAANTSLLERQQAAVQAQALIRAAEQDTFELAQAQGRVTETEAVEHARNIALSWKEGTKQRIDAEKQFATQAKAAWDSLAQAGRSLEDMAITRLAASGRALSQANIAGEISKIKGEASGLNDVWQRGGTLTQEQLTLLRAWSDANAKLATQGQTEYGALRASADQLNNGVHGVVMSVESLAGKGTSVSMFGNALVTASTGATRAATSVEELSAAARRAAEQERLFGQAGDQAFDVVTNSAGELLIRTKEIGTQIGSGIAAGLRASTGEATQVFRSFLGELTREAISGVGPIGAAFAEAFERRLIQMIDSAANRN
jgi:hypothetical protein